jgi:hypothetical protein
MVEADKDATTRLGKLGSAAVASSENLTFDLLLSLTDASERHQPKRSRKLPFLGSCLKLTFSTRPSTRRGGSGYEAKLAEYLENTGPGRHRFLVGDNYRLFLNRKWSNAIVECRMGGQLYASKPWWPGAVSLISNLDAETKPGEQE